MVHIFSPCFCAEHFELGPAGHLAVVAHDFADDGRRLQSREAAQIDAAFGLPRANQHAAVAGAERIDMARAKQILRLGVLGDGDLDRRRPVVGAHAGA